MEVRELLRQIWLDPNSLNPALRRAQVTRDIAALLARLASALEGTPTRPRYDPRLVASFLMRCIFCMFAQSVDLLPERRSFSDLLERCKGNLPAFTGLVRDLWRTMDTGGFSAALAAVVLRFNGGLFRADTSDPADPLSVTADELNLLIMAAGKNWADVEPAIFGTLLENALDAKDRGRLGAQFTPRSFVERLVLPTVMEPLRTDWDGVCAAAEGALRSGDQKAAANMVRTFHAQLCAVRVLDPACGTGNFLYVTLELMKRLEGEVLDALAGLDEGEVRRLDLGGVTVDPHQFFGLDVNPRAVPVAELVLWIGYLQWHFRTHSTAPPAEPILRDFHTIREADALLSYTQLQEERDREGNVVTRWGGRTKLHPITGDLTPDETDRVPVMRPIDARQAVWPDADFIVGNPPFVAAQYLREKLGSGYVEALWAVYPKVPQSVDLAMFFWWRAAQCVSAGKTTRRFGLITSNAIRKIFSGRLVASSLQGKKRLHLVFAIPDHPWSQYADSAAVRIAMTVATREMALGRLLIVEHEDSGDVPNVTFREQVGVINADFTIGSSLSDARALKANRNVCSPGMKLHGAGFIISPTTAKSLGLGRAASLEQYIRPFLSGRDMTARSRGQMVIDLFGLKEEEVRQRYPLVLQHVLLKVKPERDLNNRGSYRDKWWIFGEPRGDFRPSLKGLTRYITTVFASSHRVFTFQPSEVLPDNSLVCFATDESWHLGVLSSRIHVAWTLATGGTLEDRPLYTKTRCFDPFPFPTPDASQAKEVGRLAEALDNHRKALLAEHPHLTLTSIYNVLAIIQAGRELTEPERDIHDAGQISLMRHLHDELDKAVSSTYGWPIGLAAHELVDRLLRLNRDRVAEELSGLVRWLRPTFQMPADQRSPTPQPALDVSEGLSLAIWPKQPPAQFVALRTALVLNGPSSPADVVKQFRGVTRGRIVGMLASLAALGQARETSPGRWVA